MSTYEKRIEKLSLEDKITGLLMEHPEARNSDRALYKLFIRRYYPALINVPFSVFMDHADVPSFESISRSRRKAQERNDELKAVAEVQKHRYNKETEYIDYAINS